MPQFLRTRKRGACRHHTLSCPKHVFAFILILLDAQERPRRKFSAIGRDMGGFRVCKPNPHGDKQLRRRNRKRALKMMDRSMEIPLFCRLKTIIRTRNGAVYPVRNRLTLCERLPFTGRQTAYGNVKGRLRACRRPNSCVKNPISSKKAAFSVLT